MHLQQTKRGSRKTGGPQYYFHDLTDVIKTYLRSKGAIRVALVTPYGATKSDYYAISKDHKLDGQGKVVSGKVGHDRIQQGQASESIGEAIRKWYNLPNSDFERIHVDIEIVEDILYLTPIRYKFATSQKENEITKIERPLTFIKEYQSPFWKKPMASVDRSLVLWSLAEICRIVKDNKPETKARHVQETDILRASGPLKHLGVALGAYVGKGYDCYSEFTFLNYPTYSVPVEIKRHSKDFRYQQKKYGKDELSRAVILCAVHDLRNVPKNIDVIEL
ncbi:MAG TPA: hypothetical protein VNO70_11590, partial [Blastocatellia bacterium]|nr:hypothetical protein [Blastocatellia bacterium]